MSEMRDPARTRHSFVSTYEPHTGVGFRRVTSRDPCPICGRKKWCQVTRDRRLAHCMWESRGSIKRAKDDGYIHVLTHDVSFTPTAHHNQNTLNHITADASEPAPLEKRKRLILNFRTLAGVEVLSRTRHRRAGVILPRFQSRRCLTLRRVSRPQSSTSRCRTIFTLSLFIIAARRAPPLPTHLQAQQPGGEHAEVLDLPRVAVPQPDIRGGDKRPLAFPSRSEIDFRVPEPVVL